MENIQTNKITQFLQGSDLSQKEKIDQLFTLLNNQIKTIANSQLKKLNPNGEINPTLLVNECYVGLSIDKDFDISNRKHFYSLAAKSMRFFLLDLFKKQNAKKNQHKKVSLTLSLFSSDGVDETSVNIKSLDDALIDLETVDEKLAKIVELRFYWGLSLQEIAEINDSSISKIFKDWQMAKSLLHNLIK